MEAAGEIISGSFDSVLGTNTVLCRYWKLLLRKSKLRSIKRATFQKIVRWLTCIAACSKKCSSFKWLMTAHYPDNNCTLFRSCVAALTFDLVAMITKVQRVQTLAPPPSRFWLTSAKKGKNPCTSISTAGALEGDN